MKSHIKILSSLLLLVLTASLSSFVLPIEVPTGEVNRNDTKAEAPVHLEYIAENVEFELIPKRDKLDSELKLTGDSDCNRVKDKSWRCCGKLYAYSNGHIRAELKTSSNRLEGFSGACVIVLRTSKTGTDLAVIETPGYGVNGNSERFDVFTTEVHPAIVKEAGYIGGFAKRKSGGIVKNILKAGKVAIDVYKAANE